MPSYEWRKSSFSGDAGNCVYVAAAPDGTVKLRESDTPDTILTTTPKSLEALLHQVKTGNLHHFTE